MRLSDPDTMFTTYTARGQRYVFLWRADQFGALCLQLARWSARRGMDFNWVDAVLVYRSAREQLEARNEL